MLEALHCKETLQKSKKEIEEMTFLKKKSNIFSLLWKRFSQYGY